jgi:membrane protease YdiL (CAAX protease family)
MRKSIDSIPVPMFLVTMLQGLGAGATVNAVAGFGEEAGWRGYLVRSMKGSSFWIASVFIGAIWGLWHAPLIIQGYNYPDHPVAGVFLMIVFCLLVSPIILYIRMRTRSSVAAAIAHGAINGTAGVAMIPLSGGSVLAVGIMDLAGLVALAVLAIYLVDRRSKRPVMSLRLGEEFPAGF